MKKHTIDVDESYELIDWLKNEECNHTFEISENQESTFFQRYFYMIFLPVI